MPGASEWELLLSRALKRAVRVRFGRARRQVVSARWTRARGGAEPLLEVRMNAFFERAPADVQQAVAAWLERGTRAKQATARLDAWIEEQLDLLEGRAPSAPQAASARRASQHHDLQAILDELLEREFAHDAALVRRVPRIGWAPRSARPARRTLRLGSCDPRRAWIRIHPVLDQAGVPRFFVRSIVHHELLHAVLPPRRGQDGRNVIHGPEFRRRERAYVDHERARAWEIEHIDALVRSARTGQPLRARARVAARTARTRSGAATQAAAPATSAVARLGGAAARALRGLQGLLFTHD